MIRSWTRNMVIMTIAWWSWNIGHKYLWCSVLRNMGYSHTPSFRCRWGNFVEGRFLLKEIHSRNGITILFLNMSKVSSCDAESYSEVRDSWKCRQFDSHSLSQKYWLWYFARSLGSGAILDWCACCEVAFLECVPTPKHRNWPWMLSSGLQVR